MTAHAIPRLLTKTQTAALLDVSRATVDRLAGRGLLTPIKIGPRLVRFSEDDLADLIRRGRPSEPLAPEPHPIDRSELEWQ